MLRDRKVCRMVKERGVKDDSQGAGDYVVKWRAYRWRGDRKTVLVPTGHGKKNKERGSTSKGEIEEKKIKTENYQFGANLHLDSRDIGCIRETGGSGARIISRRMFRGSVPFWIRRWKKN